MFCSAWFFVWHLTLVIDWKKEGYCDRYECDDHEKPLWLEFPIAFFGVYIEMFIFLSQLIFAIRYLFAMEDKDDHIYNRYVDINYKVDYTSINLKRIGTAARDDEKKRMVIHMLNHEKEQKKKHRMNAAAAAADSKGGQRAADA